MEVVGVFLRVLTALCPCRYAVIPACADLIVQDGGIEACVCALRANTSRLGVVQSATNTLAQLATSDAGAIAVAKKGGSRQILNTMLVCVSVCVCVCVCVSVVHVCVCVCVCSVCRAHACVVSVCAHVWFGQANAGTPGFAAGMNSMLAVLQRIAVQPDGADMLIKQVWFCLLRLCSPAKTTPQLSVCRAFIAGKCQLRHLVHVGQPGRSGAVHHVVPCVGKVGHP